MQLFELVSPRLFRPLAGPNRAFYAELLLLLWEECRHTADYSISRAEAVWRAEDYFAALAKPLALDADGAGDEEEQPTRDPHTLAMGFLLRLRRTGWLEEQPGSYEGEASLAFVPEVTPLLEALEEILNPRVVTYTGKLYKAWQLLGSIGQEKSPYENVLREVDADLDALNRSPDWRDYRTIPWGDKMLPPGHGFGGITGKVSMKVCNSVYVDRKSTRLNSSH